MTRSKKHSPKTLSTAFYEIAGYLKRAEELRETIPTIEDIQIAEGLGQELKALIDAVDDHFSELVDLAKADGLDLLDQSQPLSYLAYAARDVTAGLP
jgi:hypothetical protein